MRISVLLLSVLLLTGCFVSRGVVHTVHEGETFWRICQTYGADMDDVAELNGIKDPSSIRAGTKIFIPGASKRKRMLPGVRKASVGDYRRDYRKEDLARYRGRFIWPVEGKVASRFGTAGGVRHDGLDILAPEGKPVKAADDGTVVYVDRSFKGYGNIVILKHADDFYTVYAHNSSNSVSLGDTVRKGDLIATVGSTGDAGSSQLHFEIRKGKTVKDPLFFLP